MNTFQTPPAPQVRGPQRSRRTRADGQPREDIFRPGFTVFSNAYLDDPDIQLSRPQSRLFQQIVRLTTGFLMEWTRLQLDFILKKANLQRSAFYQARKELVEMQLIEVMTDDNNAPWVRLAPHLQPLKPEYIATIPASKSPYKRQPWSPQFMDSESMNCGLSVHENRTPPNTWGKEEPDKENSTRQQHQTDVVVEPIASAQEPPSLPDPPPEPAPPLTAPPEQRAKVENAPLTKEQSCLAEVLQGHKVAPEIAERLARTRTAEAIGRAVSDLTLAKDIFNPGGWLYKGLMSGRYDHEVVEPATVSEAAAHQERQKPAPKDLTSAQREAQLETLRQRDQAEQRQERARADAQTARETAQILGALTADQLQSLEKRAKASFRNAPMSEAMIKGAMLGLLENDRRLAS